MKELQTQLGRILEQHPYKLVLSAPRSKHSDVRRAEIRLLDGKWQLERVRGKQAFHENVRSDELLFTLMHLLTEEFTQLHAFSNKFEHSLRLTKKGGVLVSRKAAEAPSEPKDVGHDRKKNYLLTEGAIIPPLVDMGVFTPDGRVAKARHDKYRQINRFVELIDDALPEPAPKKLRVIDFGCGKSYLTFIVYYYLTQLRGIAVEMTGLDLKADVVEKCNAAAHKYGYGGLSFQVGDIGGWQAQGPVDMVLSLHACDTATDLALANAVRWEAKLIFSVPCCQHELNGQIQSEAFSILTRYGIVKERVAALMTDAVRANLLEACGYKTQLVEFVGFEHTPKNILIRGVKTAVPKSAKARMLAEARRLCREFNLDPAIWRLLAENPGFGNIL